MFKFTLKYIYAESDSYSISLFSSVIKKLLNIATFNGNAKPISLQLGYHSICT